MVEGDGDSHVDVYGVLGMRTQEHHLVVVGEVVVGDCDVCGALNGIHQTVRGIGQEVVIHPQVVRAENGHCVSVCHSSVPDMGRCAYHLHTPQKEKKEKRKVLARITAHDRPKSSNRNWKRS